MDMAAGALCTVDKQQHCSSSLKSEEGSADKGAEECSSSRAVGHKSMQATWRSNGMYNSMQAVASGAHHHTSENSAAYFHWPPTSHLQGTAGERVAYFSGLQKDDDEKGICFFTDFLIVGENKQVFDLEGDSGSLILMTQEDGGKPRPVGIIWGGTANRGRLKLHNGQGPENWTSGVDLGRLLDLLQLSLITSRLTFPGGSSQQESPGRGLVDGEQHHGIDGMPTSDTVTTLTRHGSFRTEDSPITTLRDSSNMLTDSRTPTRELELLDFGFAPHNNSLPLEDAEPSSYNSVSTTEELSFGLQLFDRDKKKKRLS